VRLGFTFNVRSTTRSNSPDIGLAGDAEEEFDSPETIDEIAGAMRSLGHEVELLGDGEPLLRRLLNGPRPELVFNMAEGSGIARSREARVPALLEMLGIPFTGSDPLTLAVALDKPLAKTIVAAAGVAVPRGMVVSREGSGCRVVGSGLKAPLIAKPAFEGSSKGVLRKCVIEEHAQIESIVAELQRAYRQPILLEEFIEGDELTVGVVGNTPPQVIGVMRIVPKRQPRRFVYSLEVKRDWEDEVRYECPAQVSSDATTAVQNAALAAYEALGCRDVARIDFRLRDGVPYFIEANPLPGLSPKSGDIVILAGAMRIEYRELLGRILGSAVQRYPVLGGNSQRRSSC
jgi:D-alanine-D-alanine ligase